MRYTITVVEIRENYKKEKEIGHTERNSGLKFPTIEAAEDLCKQLGIENYQIIDSTKEWSCSIVKQSQTITDIETREKNNRDNEIKEKTARVVEINKLPTKFLFKSYKIDEKKVEFYFVREEASFDHHMSWLISCSLSFYMEINGSKEYRDLWLDDYVTQYGKRIMRKKFENEMLSRLFHWTKWEKKPKDEKQVEAVAPIVADLEEMIKKEKELRNKIS